MKGHETIVKLLLEKLLLDKGANPETKDNYGKTSLSSTAHGEATVKFLLGKGADREAEESQ